MFDKRYIWKVKTASLLLLILGLYSCASQNNGKQVTPPLNVILIMADDLGYETIQANGGALII